MTTAEIAAERIRLQAMLTARDGKSGYSKNVLAIKAALAALDKEVPSDAEVPPES